jgi:uncharacterized protein (TIGR02246 family)
LSELDELRTRVDRLESREAIRELVSAYAVACDHHDMPALDNLFTEDALFASPNGAMVAKGRDAIHDMFARMLGIRGPGYHWTHDVTVNIDPSDPDRATGVVHSHAETTPSGVMSIAAMRYHDSYRREAGIWRFASREISFLYYVPVSEYGASLTRPDRVVMGTERHAADYPEALEAWQAFEASHGGA